MDRLFDWKAQTDAPIQQSLSSQKDHVHREFDERLAQSVLNLNEQGLNVALYWKNPDKRKYVNVVPTSAITGEGLPDMLQLLVDLTQVCLPILLLPSHTGFDTAATLAFSYCFAEKRSYKPAITTHASCSGLSHWFAARQLQ